MTALIVVIIVMIVCAYVLFAPFNLSISSRTGTCCLDFDGRSVITLTCKRHLWLTVNSALGEKEIDVLNLTASMMSRKRKPLEKRSRHRSKRNAGTLKSLPDRIINVLKSFRINVCDIRLDTGSMPLNGLLFPGFYLFSRYTGKTMVINFNGQNEINLQIQNSIAGMLWAFIKTPV